MVHEASVKTAAVEVRVLTISGKQVTLAVFRQLIDEPIIDWDTITFRGLPWGTVNYHPDDRCKGVYGYGEHYHVVWQKGDELRRCVVRKDGFDYGKCGYDALSRRIEALERVLKGIALLAGEGRAHENPTSAPTRYASDDALSMLARWPASYTPLHADYAGEREEPPDPGWFCAPGVPYKAPAPAYDHAACARAEEQYRREMVAYERAKADYERERPAKERAKERRMQWEHERSYNNAVADVRKGVGKWTPDTAQAAIEEARTKQAAMEAAWEQRWAEVCALDQLFIAV